MKPKKIERILEAEKIAAGEVVERPVNIVKELIENSLDAEASEIRIIIKKAGKSLIQIIDNGIGIPAEDIEIAFERYTSSKIRSINDLEKLSTLGFRGEALASIAAVSKVEIISKTEMQDKGVQLLIESSKILSKKEISCQNGTNIIIKNLFYNLPARQKFLKKDSTELGHITDIIQRYSLANPKVHFIYRHNDLDILNCPAMNDLKTTVFHIYGRKNAKLIENIHYSEKNINFKIHGLIGHPQISRKSRSYSSLFINQRYIINDKLFRAIEEAYEGTLMISKYPFFVLFLELDPSIVDFNIHPKKLEVRFQQEESIYNKIYNIIRNFVEDKFILKEAKYISTELEDFIPSEEKNQAIIKKPVKEIQEKKENVKVDIIQEKIKIEESVQLKLDGNISNKKVNKNAKPHELLRENYINLENFPKLRLISYTGQLKNKVYVVLEGINENNEEGLFILDQHAASERIKKEKFLALYKDSKRTKQKLITPLKIDLSLSEKIFLEESIQEINKLGFTFEQFGGNTFILREIPTIIGKMPDINIIKEIISDMTNIGKDKSFSEVKEEIINYLACHKSIRGGDDLSLKDIRNIIMDLAKCVNPFHCAHGRPTLRFFSFKELDKLFKRKV